MARVNEFFHDGGADKAGRSGYKDTYKTFFRHFADKREVLFSGAGGLQDQVAGALDNAPVSLSAIDAVGEALQAAAALLGQRRDYARRRQAIITANAELQERERIKLAPLASALADGLRRRGVGDPAAILAAEAGIAVFRVAFERWIDESEHRALPQVIRDSLNELKAVTARRRVRSPRHPQ
jgi:hypothetical protein